jgi:phosphoribosyl-ATP pyrophosphohydrolase
LTPRARVRHAARMDTPSDTLVRLEATIKQRLGASPDESYVAKLHAQGLPVIARKLGEEAVETITAALSGTREELTSEAADVLFHLLVLLAEKGIALADVLAELDRREGVSGLDEKAARQP